MLSTSVERAIEKNERSRKLVYYRVAEMPAVRNSSEAASRKNARGQVRSENEIVVDRPEAESNKQLVEQPDQEKRLDPDTSLANVIAQSAPPETVEAPKAAPRKMPPLPDQAARKLESADPFSEAPPSVAASLTPLTAAALAEIRKLPKPAPKKFQEPDSARVERPVERNLEFTDVPLWDNRTQQNAAAFPQTPSASNLPVLPKIAPKKFTPPAAAQGPARPASSEQADFGAIPSVASANAGTGAPAAEGLFGNGQIPKAPPRRFQPPPGARGGTGTGSAGGAANPVVTELEAPPGLQGGGKGNSAGLSPAELAVLSANPGKGLPPPKSGLGGKFSQAREYGDPAHVANNNPDAIALPGVSTNPVRPGITNPKLPEAGNKADRQDAEEFFQIRLDLKTEWPRLSIPLSPANRMLPRRIEPFFRGRTVFTVVIPIERMDRYAGDWIVWFAPQASGGAGGLLGTNAKVETPLPHWKLESRAWLVRRGEQSVEQRVQVNVSITKEGRLVMKELLTSLPAPMREFVGSDLGRWVFQPARLEGEPIDVDAIMEIPFRLPAGVQISAQ
jgi:hypothetical protein